MVDQQCNDEGLRELALFAGAGGGILGGQLLGWRTVCAVERDAYCAAVLAQRQDDGILPPFPIWSDIETFDGRPWRGIIDVVSGGFPCQDISAAGKGAGIEGSRSGLWEHMSRVVREVRPRFVFVENSPVLTSRGLGRVLGDLAEVGYDARWFVLGAGDIGAWHSRKRIWVLASNNWEKRIQRGIEKKIYRKQSIPWSKNVRGVKDLRGRSDVPIPLIRGVRNGVANYVDRISAIGNGQVPICMATAFQILLGEVD